MRTRFFFCLMIPCMLLLSACNKGAAPAYNDRPVVAGYLAAGTQPLITISRQASTSSDIVYSGEDLNSLHITLSDGISDYTLTALDSGRYTDSSVILEAGKTYTLSFAYNGKTVTASTTIPLKPKDYSESVASISVQKIDSNFVFTPGSFTMPDPIELSWTNDDNSYYLLVTENLERTRELIRDTLAMGRNRPAFSFRNEPSISIGARINPGQFEYFGKHRIILYKLLPDYAALYESVSNSSSSLSTVASKVSNGFGIFTGMNADTLYLEVNKK